MSEPIDFAWLARALIAESVDLDAANVRLATTLAIAREAFNAELKEAGFTRRPMTPETVLYRRAASRQGVGIA